MSSPSCQDQRTLALVADHVLPHLRRISGACHEKPEWRYGWAFDSLRLALLAAVYFSAAKLGLTMAFVTEQVTAVWPPTGIALAAILFFGYRVWPAITLGAFLTNATANEPLATATGIALGNTLEALLAAWLLRAMLSRPGTRHGQATLLPGPRKHATRGFDPPLARVKDVLGLVVLAAGLSTMVSATVGMTSLYLGGVTPWTACPAVWSVWWLGDAMGDLVVAPLLLTGVGWHRILWRPRRVAEVGTLLLALIAVSLFVFVGRSAILPSDPMAYAVFPFVIWAALRFGQPGATLATFVASTIAIWGTAHGYGPFTAPTTHESLISLQLFMGVVAATTLVLAAVTTERERAKETRSRLSAIVKSSEDAIFSKDMDGIILTWNRAAEKMYGYTAAEIVGRPVCLLVPAERAGQVSPILEQLKGGERVENRETVGLRTDGTRIDVSLSISPIPDATGRVTGSSVIARDITARKRRERHVAAEHAVTRALADSGNLEDAVPKVLETVGKTLGCDLGVLWEVSPAAGVLRCVAIWHRPGIEVTEFEQHSGRLAFARGEGLAGRAWDSGQPAWVPEAPFPRSVPAQRSGPCGALAVPLRGDGDVLGVLECFSPEFRQPQDAVLDMMASIGIQIGQFIERRRAEVLLHERAREFRLAREIQQGLLPQTPPALAGFAIAGASHPTQETGGDYFDFIPMSDGHLGISVGDASGHGIGAALLIAATCAYVRALALTHSDPGTILSLLNIRLAEDISSHHFVTLLFARLCPRTRSLVFSNAGHWPGYVLDAQGEVKQVLQSTSFPLGVDPSGKLDNGPALTLDPGDLVFLLSDGIVEAPSGAGSLFGVGRALEVVRAHRHETPDEIIAALLHQVREWSESAQVDDMTAIVIKVGG